MAAEIVKGTGVVWSTAGLSMSATGLYAAGKIQSISYELNGDVVEVKDDNAAVAAVVLANDIENLTVEVVPTGSTIAAAVANFILPARGADVTITDTVDGEINSAVFMFIDGSKNRTVDGVGTLTMNIRRYGAATLSTIAAS
jgi:hypothetical protein